MLINSSYRFKAFALFFIVFLHSICYGQNPPFINYNEQSGLSTGVIYGLFQDLEDNVWFCTNAGVVKYNGNKLTVYEKKDGLSDNEVFKIYQDSRGRLWFMTSNGQLSYYFNKKIYNARDHPIFSQLKITSFISDIREDENKNIWIIPAEGNIYSLTADLKEVKQIAAKLHNGIFFSYKSANYLSCQEGIYSIQTASILLPAPNFKLASIVTRYCRDGELVYSGRDKRLNVYNLQTRTAKAIDMPDLPAVLNSIVKIDTTLYVCSGNGLSLYNAVTLKRTRQYFGTANVSHIIKDREGSIWIATLNEGVMYIPNMQINFLRSADFFGGNKILKLNGLGGDVIIGQSNSKVDHYKNGILRSITSSSESKGEGLTYSIKANSGDSSFLISTQSGLSRFSLHTGMRKINNMNLLDYASCSKDSAYISTPTVLGKFSKDLGLAQFTDRNSGAIFDSVRAAVLYYDSNNAVLYAGTKQGLYTYKNKTRVPQKFEAFEGNNFTDLDKNKDSVFIATTRDAGLFFFSGNAIHSVNEKEGLSDSKCSSLFIQNDSTIWVTTHNGLNKIVYHYAVGLLKFKIKNYYKNDGLPSNYLNDIYINGDSLWLATNNGLAIINENDLNEYTYTPKLTIHAFKSNNEYKETGNNETIQLERNSNDIAIEFNCATFKNAASIRYKYRIDAADKNWIETRNTQVDITGLGPGKYKFEVYAYSINENWRSNTAQLSFSISAAYWETMWFKIACIIGILAIAAILVFYQFRKVKNKFAIRQKFLNYEKELLELEQQALRVQMNPHFIFNALNSIQHSILSGKQDEAYHHLELFSSLIRGILENSKHKFISLEDEIEILKIYVQIEAARFEGNFKYEVLIDDAIDISCVKIPPMLIQPFVENSIWHGLMPKTNGEKKLILSFTATPGEIICTIEDNGIGRKNAAERKEKKHGTSLGTALTMNRVANINLLENKKYSIDILDKENGRGTIVTIKIQI